MRRPKRSPRLATLCVRGRAANEPAMNKRRLALLQHAVLQLAEFTNWAPLDALVLPAGYFRIRRYLGPRDHASRIKALSREPFLTAIVDFCTTLEADHPGILIIVGVDSDGPSRAVMGDQFGLAVSAAGIVGLARKVFPTASDTSPHRRCYIPAAEDFVAASRYIVLPSGNKAVLCACYDMFGLAESAAEPTIRTSAIRRLYADGKIVDARDPAFARLRTQCVAGFEKQFLAEAPDLALAVLHGFARPGLDNYWQRHGLATASSMLFGKLALASAHFRSKLPRIDQAPLAAIGAPDTHLIEGLYRTAWRRDPSDDCTVIFGGSPAAVLRLYSGS
jgi:hypothetical protein